MTPDRIEELRRIITEDTWRFRTREDGTEMLDEIRRLRVELADARVSVREACCGPWHDYETSKIDEARFPWERIKAAREVAHRWHSHAYAEATRGPHAASVAWSVAQTVLSLVLAELDHDGMQDRQEPQTPREDAPGTPQAPAGAPVMDFPSKAANEPQRPAEGVGFNLAGLLHTNQRLRDHLKAQGATRTDYHDAWQCADETVALAAGHAKPIDLSGELDDLTPEQLTELKRISAPGTPAALARREDWDGPPAPEDEGISTADVHAQIAADQRAYCPDCGHPETNCACG